jgi:hypothetical protein
MATKQDTPAALTPAVGMGAYRPIGSDRYAYTIVRVSKSGREICARQCNALRIDSEHAFSDAQRYAFAEDDDATIERYTLRRSGRWVLKGHPDKPNQGTRLHIGERRAYQDPTF